MVKNYRANKDLRNLVRSYIGLAHVPPNKLEEAFRIINKTYNFTDPQEQKFKAYMEQYFLKYWLHNDVGFIVFYRKNALKRFSLPLIKIIFGLLKLIFIG